MHETPDDIRALQKLLDRSYERAGSHLRSITTPDRRVGAEELVQELSGMCLLVVATVTADCRPIAGPLDGIFYRGAFHFGTAPDSVRYRHLLERPQVSATHLPARGVRGQRARAGRAGRDHRRLRETLFEVYVPRYGGGLGALPGQRSGVHAHRRRPDVHVPDGLKGPRWGIRLPRVTHARRQ